MSEKTHSTVPRVVALCGGVGGAKLALGLQQTCGAEALIAVNTGDDFEHLGLSIAPDLDTVMYTLGGLADPERGWGRAQESWTFMESLRLWGGETWFQLGDHDLALHVERTRRLRLGERLTDVMRDLCTRANVAAQVIPMSDDPVRTWISTAAGRLAFQHYFVRERCVPVVQDIDYEGAMQARPAPQLMAALADPHLRAVIVCPSNPYLSIAPILAMPGVRDALRATAAPVVVVSPIVAGDAVKGPTAKLMREFGVAVDNAAIARYYADVADAIVIDSSDAREVADFPMPVHVTRTLMRSDADRRDLAIACLSLADRLGIEG